MQVEIVKPYGFCSGVHAAMELAEKTKLEHPDQDVYLLGMPVHNEDAIEYLTSKGLILLDERKKSLEEHLRSLKKGDVVIFSAHGHPERYDEIAKEMGLETVDSTCPFVNDNLLTSRKLRKEGRSVIYVGSKGHLESEAFLVNAEPEGFYDVKSQTLTMKKEVEEDAALIAQTTLSADELSIAEPFIQKRYRAAMFEKGRCLATQVRQNAIRDLDYDNLDAVIVLGSKTSNNSVKLYELAAKHCLPTYLVLDLKEVKKLPLGDYEKIALASGASTSRAMFQSVLEYLQAL